MAYKKYDAYHLGMQPEDVKEALQGGGGGGGDSIVIDGTLAMQTVGGQMQAVYSIYHSDDYDDAQAFLDNIITEIVSGKRIFVKFAGEIMGKNMFETTDRFIAFCQDGDNVYLEAMLGYIGGSLDWYTVGVSGQLASGFDVCAVITAS